jgi:hypothetical protein
LLRAGRRRGRGGTQHTPCAAADTATRHGDAHTRSTQRSLRSTASHALARRWCRPAACTQT